MELTELCKSAKEVSRQIGNLDTNTKNEVLRAAAEALVAHTDEIIRENEKDLARGRENHMPEGLLDRLMLTPSRMEQMAEGLRQVADLADPIGEVLSMKKRPNGLMIGKKRVPLGVVGMIYEARPNVTVDAFALCFKTGNAVILKGGSDAILSNIVIVSVLQEVLEAHGIPRAAVSLIEDTSRETAAAFMKMNEYVDVLIPRGGAGLIRAVVNQATIPVIETGTGNCHIYVDESADFDMAIRIILNAKTQRIGVCNVHEVILTLRLTLRDLLFIDYFNVYFLFHLHPYHLRTCLPVSIYNIFCAGQRIQSHRSSCMKLLGTDADLRAKSKFKSV